MQDEKEKKFDLNTTLAATLESALSGLFGGIEKLTQMASDFESKLNAADAELEPKHETEPERESNAKRKGEFEFGKGGKTFKGIYGVHVRTVSGGNTVAETFGNIRRNGASVKASQPVDSPSSATAAETVSPFSVSPEREPLVDVFDEGAEIKVYAELPGVAETDILVALTGDILDISTALPAGDAVNPKRSAAINSKRPAAITYRKELLLPAPVKPDSLRTAYCNGVLEISIEKA